VAAGGDRARAVDRAFGEDDQKDVELTQRRTAEPVSFANGEPV
jgi:hypothetical protein